MTLQELHDLVARASEQIGEVRVPCHLLDELAKTQDDLIIIRGRLRILIQAIGDKILDEEVTP
jgi:hypothetical protein